MSVKSFNHQRPGFTPYRSSLEDKQLSLFSRLNLNQNDKSSMQRPLKNFAEYQSSDLYSMRSRKRKGSAQLQLKESLPGNRTYLNVSLVGKSSLLHNDLFGHEQDLGLGQDYDDQKKQFSQKSCPVGPSYGYQDQSQVNKKLKMVESQIRPRFHKTKNLLRTIGSYLHKFILHNKRSQKIKEKYFKRLLLRKTKIQQNEQKISIQAFEKIKIQDSQNNSAQNIQQEKQKNKKKKKSQRKNSQTLVEQKQIQKSKANQKKQKDLLELFKLEQQRDKNTSNKKDQVQSNKIQKNGLQQQENQDLRRSNSTLLQEETKQKINKFHKWVESLSVINFADYQRIWSDDHEFTSLYRQICYKYYKQQVYCDVMRSRLTIKQITNEYMCQFIEGLFNPKQFYRFRAEKY